MKHLWEVKHPYYCNEYNYFCTKLDNCYHKFSSFEEFLEGNGDADIDYNLIFRWDWVENEDCLLEGSKKTGLLSLFYMLQRKGIYRCVEVEVCREDEQAVIEFLKPRLERLKELWEPLI